MTFEEAQAWGILYNQYVIEETELRDKIVKIRKILSEGDLNSLDWWFGGFIEAEQSFDTYRPFIKVYRSDNPPLLFQ